LGEGDSGPEVAKVQTLLGVPADGDFGSITDSAVRGFQSACGLSSDGIVGPKTWEQLGELAIKVVASDELLSSGMINGIVAIAEDSEIAEYEWDDRGQAPSGYIAGVALSFAEALLRYSSGDKAAREMAKADVGDDDHDALAWYRSEFSKLHMDNSSAGVDTLRHLFALMLGLGMRESSGRYCEGRDMSADNVSSDTAEAGMYQTSWNIRSCSSTIPPLLDEYWEEPIGFLKTFRIGVSVKSSDLDNYGSGADGTKYQFLSKYAPAFHAMVTAVGLRNLRQHWGPINRREVELREDADVMLSEVQDFVEGLDLA
jgi:Putative peptidoglycan binding domain